MQEARRREAAIRSLIEAGPARHAPADVVAKEYETAWRNLNGRPIKNLIDLALMTDPELQAAMQVLSTPTRSRPLYRLELYCLHLCRMVNVNIRHGMC